MSLLFLDIAFFLRFLISAFLKEHFCTPTSKSDISCKDYHTGHPNMLKLGLISSCFKTFNPSGFICRLVGISLDDVKCQGYFDHFTGDLQLFRMFRPLPGRIRDGTGVTD